MSENTDQIKQRLAEQIRLFSECFPNTKNVEMLNLLRSALAVIEQQEQAWLKEHSHTCLHHTDAEREKSGCPVCLQTRITHLEAQLRERDAQAAAMREALQDVHASPVYHGHYMNESGERITLSCYPPDCAIAKALSTDAGKDLLERLQQREDLIEVLKANTPSIQPLLERLQKAEAFIRFVADECEDKHVCKLAKERLQPKSEPEADQPSCGKAMLEWLQAVEKENVLLKEMLTRVGYPPSYQEQLRKLLLHPAPQPKE